ncbi:hypothetical protein K466DRAFT_344504 [Polyporus arcularius HHB13444]|uniref:Uncharacterized protein n=1 Tax=Polyporus arcularius HHB13444 TaxID=1314778 RepID=A0A5C3NVD4_9APHY|nr:hypothetical protein K466DRAFT_344504 [Polyporus arcularius HHB13444]
MVQLPLADEDHEESMALETLQGGCDRPTCQCSSCALTLFLPALLPIPLCLTARGVHSNVGPPAHWHFSTSKPGEGSGIEPTTTASACKRMVHTYSARNGPHARWSLGQLYFFPCTLLSFRTASAPSSRCLHPSGCRWPLRCRDAPSGRTRFRGPTKVRLSQSVPVPASASSQGWDDADKRRTTAESTGQIRAVRISGV